MRCGSVVADSALKAANTQRTVKMLLGIKRLMLLLSFMSHHRERWRRWRQLLLIYRFSHIQLAVWSFKPFLPPPLLHCPLHIQLLV